MFQLKDIAKVLHFSTNKKCISMCLSIIFLCILAPKVNSLACEAGAQWSVELGQLNDKNLKDPYGLPT